MAIYHSYDPAWRPICIIYGRQSGVVAGMANSILVLLFIFFYCILPLMYICMAPRTLAYRCKDILVYHRICHVHH